MKNQNLIIFLVVFGAFMITLIASGIQHSFGLYLIPVTEYLNIGREQFGFAFALQVFISGLGAFIFGAFSDKYGSGIAAFSGGLIFIIGLIWFANVQSSLDIIISQALIGFGGAGVGTINIHSSFGGTGGNGGTLGSAGINAVNGGSAPFGMYSSAGSGGAAGVAINGWTRVNAITEGTILGAKNN